jgi:hypothetical protein
MTPILIPFAVSSMSANDMQEKLKTLSSTFCKNTDFTEEAAVANLIQDLEVHVLEALLRIFELKLGYVPFQNKIYEKTENYFGNQDAYNINRMMSSLRRTKVVPLNSTDEKYLTWMKNRILYGVKTLVTELSAVELQNAVVSRQDNVRTPVTV